MSFQTVLSLIVEPGSKLHPRSWIGKGKALSCGMYNTFLVKMHWFWSLPLPISERREVKWFQGWRMSKMGSFCFVLPCFVWPAPMSLEFVQVNGDNDSSRALSGESHSVPKRWQGQWEERKRNGCRLSGAWKMQSLRKDEPSSLWLNLKPAITCHAIFSNAYCCWPQFPYLWIGCYPGGCEGWMRSFIFRMYLHTCLVPERICSSYEIM